MGVIVGRSQAHRRQMGVNLSRRKRSVPKQFLDRPQVGAVIQHVGGETVTQRVRADTRIQPRLGQILIQLAAYAAAGTPTSASGVERD